MSSVTVTENNNKVSVDKTTNVVTVTSPGTVGPQGGSGTIESATASASEVAVSNAGASGDPTVAITLGGTVSARTMAFAFGVPTGASGSIGSIVTTGTDGINIDSGGTMDSYASTIQLGINAQTLWTHILNANVTGNALTVSDGSNTSPIALEGTITYAAVANETTVAESAGTITIGLVANPVVSGVTAGNVKVGVTGDNEIDTLSGNLTLDSAGGTVAIDDHLTVAGTLTGVAGTFSGAVAGTTGTFSSHVVGVNGTFSGAVAGTTGTFSSNISSTGSTAGNIQVGVTGDNEIDTSSGGLTLDSATGTTTIDDNLNVSGNLTVSGSTTTIDSTVTTIVDPIIVLQTAVGGGALSSDTNKDTGLLMQYHTGSANKTAFLGYDDSAGKLIFIPDATVSSEVISGSTGTMVVNIEGNVTGAVTGNASTATALQNARTIGGVSFDGTGNINLPGVNTGGNQATSGNAATATALANARDIGGVSFDGTGNINLAGVNTAGNQDTSGTATTATNVTAVANNSTNETTYPTFIDGATGTQGIETDTGLTYNPSTGLLTAAGFAGPISGAVTGNATTATALATGRTIGMTGDVVWTSASFDGSGNVTGTATIQANSVAMGTDTTGNYVATVTAGTGLTSTGATSGESIAHSLSVDAAQTQITSVGTITTGEWRGTAVADAYIASAATWTAKEDAGVATAMAIALG